MQIELDFKELEQIYLALSRDIHGTNHSLRERLRAQLEQQKELDEMDFDDCVGGACRL